MASNEKKRSQLSTEPTESAEPSPPRKVAKPDSAPQQSHPRAADDVDNESADGPNDYDSDDPGHLEDEYGEDYSDDNSEGDDDEEESDSDSDEEAEQQTQQFLDDLIAKCEAEISDEAKNAETRRTPTPSDIAHAAKAAREKIDAEYRRTVLVPRDFSSRHGYGGDGFSKAMHDFIVDMQEMGKMHGASQTAAETLVYLGKYWYPRMSLASPYGWDVRETWWHDAPRPDEVMVKLLLQAKDEAGDELSGLRRVCRSMVADVERFNRLDDDTYGHAEEDEEFVSLFPLAMKLVDRWMS